MELFVASFIFRMIHLLVFILCIIYVFFRSYNNAMEMIYGDKKERSKLVEWLTRNRKPILSILFAFWGMYHLVKTIFGDAIKSEGRLIGLLIDFSPLLISLCVFIYLYLFDLLIRSYYLNKYSEEFRKKFGYEKEVWYGENEQIEKSS